MKNYELKALREIRMPKTFVGTIQELMHRLNLTPYVRIAFRGVIKRKNEKIFLKQGDVIDLIYPL